MEQREVTPVEMEVTKSRKQESRGFSHERFKSKYDKNGKLIQTIGDNGSSSLASYYPSDFYTKDPFDEGNYDIAVNGDYLAVNYAREMYNGHQSNSILVINMDTMKKIEIGESYNSHSFAQRAVPYGDGFVFASEGDCYNRAFTISAAPDLSSGGIKMQRDMFHFWVEKGTLDNWNMFTLNNNFAHIGGLTSVDNNRVALVGTSAKSLTAEAASENEQLFIQIFDLTKDLNSRSAYVTSGNRTGYSGGNGDQKVTDYGVKWLTNYSDKYSISHPQAVADEKGNTIILYELYKNSSYKEVYYAVVNSDGKVTTKWTRYSKQAYLNPCETPIYSNNKVYWTGNKYKDTKNTMYIYSLEIDN